MRRLCIITLVVVCLACNPAKQRSTGPAAGPSVRATVVTVRTTIHPGNRTIVQTIVIAGNRARDTTERDTWRLYDVKARTVTFVDDIARTARTETFETLRRQRGEALAGAVASFHPRPTVTRSGKTKTIQNASAEQWVIAAGAYRRELWIAVHPSIPRGLFAMMQASERISSPLAPIMRDVDAALLDTKGFPLVDRSEVPMGGAPMIVERSVIGIALRDMPESLVSVPKGYRGLGN